MGCGELPDIRQLFLPPLLFPSPNGESLTYSLHVTFPTTNPKDEKMMAKLSPMPCLDDLWIRNQTPAAMPQGANPVGWMAVKSEFPFFSPHSQELCGCKKKKRGGTFTCPGEIKKNKWRMWWLKKLGEGWMDEANVNFADLKKIHIAKTAKQHLAILGNKASKWSTIT